MASVRTWGFLVLAALLLVSIVPTVTEVVNSILDCETTDRSFLLDNTPPRVPGVLEGGVILNQNRYKPICQTYRNQRRFLTLYDTKNKIPVFSAYKYIGNTTGRPNTKWKIEPQLEDDKENNNMANSDDKKVYNHQAGNTDYKYNVDFDRGHLRPNSYGYTRDDKISTFTLTNVVPQAKTFNQWSWGKMESCIKCVLENYCINNNKAHEGFVVTGAQPSDNLLKNKTNIPSMLWSAFCCYSANMEKWLASAHWGDNVPDASTNTYMETKTLAELYERLTTNESRFEVFPKQCPLHTTVAEFYKDLDAKPDCKCPPTTSAPPTSTSAPPTSTSVLLLLILLHY